MRRPSSRKYGPRLVGNRLDARGRQRSPIRTAAELDLEDRIRRAFTIHAVGPDGTVVSRAVQDIRDGRQKPCNALARRAVEMNLAGLPYDNFLKIVDTLVEWGAETFNRRPAA